MVNTCSFIESAQQESVNAILEMAAHKTGGKAKKKTTLEAGQQILIGCSLILVLTAAGVAWRYVSLTRASNQVNADIAKEQIEKARLAVIIQQIWYRFVHGQTHNPAYAGFGNGVRYLEQRTRRVVSS